MNRTSDKIKLTIAIGALLAAAFLILKPSASKPRVETPEDRQAMAELEAEQQRIDRDVQMGKYTINGS